MNFFLHTRGCLSVGPLTKPWDGPLAVGCRHTQRTGLSGAGPHCPTSPPGRWECKTNKIRACGSVAPSAWQSTIGTLAVYNWLLSCSQRRWCGSVIAHRLMWSVWSTCPQPHHLERRYSHMWLEIRVSMSGRPDTATLGKHADGVWPFVRLGISQAMHRQRACE